MDVHKTRLLGGDMNDHINETVVLIGEVLSHDGNNVVDLKSADGTQIRVIFDEAMSNLSKFVEVTGKVSPDGTLVGWTMTNFGENFDLDLYSETLKLVEAHKDVFQP
eukprot:gene9971-2147_t